MFRQDSNKILPTKIRDLPVGSVWEMIVTEMYPPKYRRTLCTLHLSHFTYFLPRTTKQQVKGGAVFFIPQSIISSIFTKDGYFLLDKPIRLRKIEDFKLRYPHYHGELPDEIFSVIQNLFRKFIENVDEIEG